MKLQSYRCTPFCGIFISTILYTNIEDRLYLEIKFNILSIPVHTKIGKLGIIRRYNNVSKLSNEAIPLMYYAVSQYLMTSPLFCVITSSILFLTTADTIPINKKSFKYWFDFAENLICLS